MTRTPALRVARGHLWSVNLHPTVANEQRGARPCLVVSRDRFNALPIRQVIVVPLTTRDRGFPHHVPVVDDGGLVGPSWVMCEGVRAISTDRFGRLIGTVDDRTLLRVAEQLALWLD